MTRDFGAILPGRPAPLGNHYDGNGVNFAVYSETARRIDLCLFDSTGRRQVRRIPMSGKTGHIWHVYVEGIGLGTLYGFRGHGAYRPQHGLPFNPSKLLVDPYARVLTGSVSWDAPLMPYAMSSDGAGPRREAHDSSRGVPKSVVFEEGFDWQGDRRPETAWRDTVIYETHVKGMTVCHPEVPEELRGKYAGLATEPVIRHLRSLGVTAIELLPVHAHADSQRLHKHGLTNYWGYDTLNFFAPDARYSRWGDRGGQVVEFKEMVRTLHQHGIEVILDVVYNHTCEGNHLGSSLSFRGLDNPTYYCLAPGDPSHYVDHTGTGNTMNVRHPQTLKLAMDSLRYWVEEMHVDGFRFDLATTLAREPGGFSRCSSFLDAVHQDPVLSRVKLIAEPWDVGEGGYQAGNFPAPWREWNDKYRDSVRSFWRGDESHREMAYRLTGSSDLYDRDGRSPHAGINFVTAHDGFTLQDLVSYNLKHNEANAEANGDGSNNNLSWNCGVEGETADRAVITLRERQKRNLLATMLLSQGVAMILGGDELSRTQRGNNNAYCQDSDVSWFDWHLDERREAFLEFFRRVLDLRRRHPSLRRGHFFGGKPVQGSAIKDVTWLREDGQEMTDEAWFTSWVRCFGMRLDGTMNEVGARGQPVRDDVLLVLLNAYDKPLDFVLPPAKLDDAWQLVLDTARPEMTEDAEAHRGAAKFRLAARSLAVLCCSNGDSP